jgi:hypothetical protein
MLLSTQSIFSDAQVVTATAASTNIIDFGEPSTPVYGNQLTPDMGMGTPKVFMCELMEDANTDSGAAGDESLTVQIETSTDSSFVHSRVLAESKFETHVKGTRLPVKTLPLHCERYVRLNYVVAGTKPDYKITAGFVAGYQGFRK